MLDAFAATQIDYEPARSLAELAAGSTRSFSGKIVSVGLSRTDGGPGNELRYAALQVRDDLTGELLWLELPISPEAIQDVLPVGMPAAGFLAPRKIFSDLPSSAEGTVIPAGSKVWSPGIQSFALQYGRNAGIVIPFTGNSVPDMAASEILTQIP